MIRQCIITAVLALCAIPIFLFAQKFENISDDLPMGRSENIFQDSYGFLWVGTNDGLIRYDGYTAVHYNHDPIDSFSINGNNINAISEDSHGYLWVGLSVEGANTFDRNSQRFKPINFPDKNGNVIKEISVNDFALNGDVMWVGTSHGLYEIESAEPHHVLAHYMHQKSDSTSLSSTYISQIFIDKNNTLWVGTLDGINQFNRDTKQFKNYHTNSSFPNRQILDIEQDPAGTLMLCPRFGEFALYTWDEKTERFQADPEFPRSLGEIKITWDHMNNMWMTARGTGTYMIDALSGKRQFFAPMQSEFHGYRNLYGLDNLTDSYGNVWFIGGNLLKWPGSNKAIQSISSNLNITISVHADKDNLWFSAKEPYVWDKDTWLLDKFWTAEFPINLRLKNTPRQDIPRIYHYENLDENQLLIATTRNISYFNKKSKTFEQYPSRVGGPFRDFVVDKESNVLWISPNQGTPVVFDLDKRTFDLPAELRPVRSAICVELGANGDVWFGSERWGLYRYNKITHTIINYSRNSDNPARRVSSTKVNDLHMDRENNLWIATSEGLNLIKYDSDSVVTIEDHDALPNNHITSVTEDLNGNIWMGTYDGLSMYSKSKGTFDHYDRTDGFINSNYIVRANYADEDGILYFGGDNGVDFFNPDALGINNIPPDVYLSKISVNNSIANTGLAPENLKFLEFDYTQKIIEIELLALHLTAPLSNTYAYRISNISKDWVDLGTNRTITLANPNPGKYRIEVKAANSDGIWSESKELISITINPPFWLTWWFILLAIITLLGILGALYQYRISQVRNKARLKGEFEKRISQLELKALRAQMNPHFLFNSLNSIKSLISAGENGKATEYVTRFSQLIRQVLSNSEQPFVRLEEDLEALRLYLTIERLRFQNFEFDIQVDENVNTDFVEIPPLLLQPYVENAIWHGLMHKTDGDRKVTVRITRDKDFLVMRVTDNGIGRERARQITMRGGSRKGGMGMRVTSDRIKLIHGFYGQEATVEVEDLMAETNGAPKAAGTSITVRIPVPE